MAESNAIFITTEDFTLKIENKNFQKRFPDFLKLINQRKNDISEDEKEDIIAKFDVDVSNSIVKNSEVFQSAKKCKKSIDGILSINNELTLDSQASSFHQKIIKLGFPYFFDNSRIVFDFCFNKDDASKDNFNVKLVHKLKRINDNFDLISDKTHLVGSIDTDNNLGYMRLPLQIDCQGRKKIVEISFYVFSVKLLSVVDMENMLKPIDKHYPFWRYSVSNPTTITLDKDDHRKKAYFPLLWLSRFIKLREELEKGLNQIIANPHMKLEDISKVKKSDLIHGKLSVKLEERIGADRLSGELKRHYTVSAKRSTLDNPENQFILHIVKLSRKRLENILFNLKQLSKDDSKSFSSAFLENFHRWCNALSSFEKHPMFKAVGAFDSVNTSSMVLQQKSGYSAVFRVWQELKYYLQVFGKECEVSLKTVNELYEIWCFLEMRNIVKSICVGDAKLGFIEQENKSSVLKKKELEYSLDDESSSFIFIKDNLIKVELIHEYKANRKKKNSSIDPNLLISWTTVQKPDIILKFSFIKDNLMDSHTPQLESDASLIFLFDAKYRLAYSKDDSYLYETSDREDLYSFVPDDAINQMHRYRDSIIRELNQFLSSRTVVGAYALYPGIFNQKDDNAKDNKYWDWIEKVNIGAFPLLPYSSNEVKNQNNCWLYNFIENTFNMFCGKNRANIFSLDGIKSVSSQLIFPSAMDIQAYKHLILGIDISNLSQFNPKNSYASEIETVELTLDITKGISTPSMNNLSIEQQRKGFISMLVSSLEYINLFSKSKNESGEINFSQIYQIQQCKILDTETDNQYILKLKLGFVVNFENISISRYMYDMNLLVLNKDIKELPDTYKKALKDMVSTVSLYLNKSKHSFVR